MRLNVIFKINAYFAFLFGFAFILTPATVLEKYSLDIDQISFLLTRLIGAVLLGYGLLAWCVGNIKDFKAQKTIILPFLISNVIGFLVVLIIQITSMVNVLGCLTIVLCLFFAVCYGHFQFTKPKETSSQQDKATVSINLLTPNHYTVTRDSGKKQRK